MNQGGKLTRIQPEISVSYRLADVFLIVAFLLLLVFLYRTSWNADYLSIASLAMVVFLVAGEIVGVYRPWRGAPLRQQAVFILIAWFITALVLLVIGYATKTTATYSRIVISGWFLGMPLVLVLWRSLVREVLRYFRIRGHNMRRVALVGAGEMASRVVSTIENHPDFGMQLIGIYDDNDGAEASVDDASQKKIKGDIDQLIQEAHAGHIDLVYITLPILAQEQIRELLKRLSDTTASVYLVPDFLMFDILQGSWKNLGDIPTLSVYETPFYGASGWVKRLEDIVLSCIILLIIAVPMLLIALAVKLSSEGTILFKQRRYGLDGSSIEVWKFRTMRSSDDGDNVPQAQRDDPRITPLGAFLRRTSMDEFPQFINVLQGQMSIVGPRPHAVTHNEEYRKLIDGYMLRHKIRPGITGWAQINGWRGETDTLDKMQQRIDHDLWYIRNWSILLDIKIIARTAWQSFIRPTAY